MDFESNPRDIINSEHFVVDETVLRRTTTHIKPLYHRSLREYCSILFLRPRMKIILRGQKVKIQLIAKSLSETEKDVYRPTWLDRPIPITFGFSSNKEDSGIMMYHNNRLIKPYCKVGIQKQNNELGVGVVGVVAVDFLEPIHNKQDFNKTDHYNTFMSGLGNKLHDYWYTKVGDGDNPELNISRRPDWTWVQCENPNCLKWRRLPDHIDPKDLPEKWYCYNNTDSMFNRCDIKEEPEDEDELLQRATYQKKKKKTPSSKIKEKEVELRHKEQYLAAKEQIVNSIPNRTRQELEATQQKLREAERREQENLAYIRMLKRREKTFLNKKETEKRDEEAKKKKNAPPPPESSSEEEEDTTPKKREKMKVRIPFKRPTLAQKASKRVVVEEPEGSDDEVVIINEVGLSKRRKKDEDVKPNVEELDKEMEVNKTGEETPATQETPANTEAPSPIPPPTPVEEEMPAAESSSQSGPEPITVAPVPEMPPASTGETTNLIGTATPVEAKAKPVVAPTPEPPTTQAASTNIGDLSNGPAPIPTVSTANKSPTAKPRQVKAKPSLPPAALLNPAMQLMMDPLAVPNLQDLISQQTFPELAGAMPGGLTVPPGLTLPTIPSGSFPAPTRGRGRGRGRGARNAPFDMPPPLDPTLNATFDTMPLAGTSESEELVVCKAELEKTRKTLLELRQNVYQLLEFIVPNQSLGSVHMVDAVVAEMLKLKKEMLDCQPKEKIEKPNDSVVNGEAAETEK